MTTPRKTGPKRDENRVSNQDKGQLNVPTDSTVISGNRNKLMRSLGVDGATSDTDKLRMLGKAAVNIAVDEMYSVLSNLPTNRGVLGKQITQKGKDEAARRKAMLKTIDDLVKPIKHIQDLLRFSQSLDNDSTLTIQDEEEFDLVSETMKKAKALAKKAPGTKVSKQEIQDAKVITNGSEEEED